MFPNITNVYLPFDVPHRASIISVDCNISSPTSKLLLDIFDFRSFHRLLNSSRLLVSLYFDTLRISQLHAFHVAIVRIKLWKGALLEDRTCGPKSDYVVRETKVLYGMGSQNHSHAVFLANTLRSKDLAKNKTGGARVEPAKGIVHDKERFSSVQSPS